MEIDFRKLKTWKGSPWWVSFTSALVATVLGIALTFGVSEYFAYREKVKFVRTSEVAAMHSIQNNIRRLDENIASLSLAVDSIHAMLKRYPDSVAYCSQSQARAFINAICDFQSLGLDQTAKELFHSNIQRIDNASDIRDFERINMLFCMVEEIQETIEEINDTRVSMTLRYLSDFANSSKTNDYKKAMMLVFDDKENYGNLYFSVYAKTEVVKYAVKALGQMSTEVQKQLNITQKDFDAFVGVDNDSINVPVEVIVE